MSLEVRKEIMPGNIFDNLELIESKSIIISFSSLFKTISADKTSEIEAGSFKELDSEFQEILEKEFII